MGEEGLNGLAMMYVHRNIDINLDDAEKCVLQKETPMETMST